MGPEIVLDSNNTNLMIPISLIFWGYMVAYIIHIIDESLLGETFVGMVQKTFWSKYQWKYFFGFNTIIMFLYITSIIIFEILNRKWIILPLSFVFLFTTNGLWHLIGTLIMKKYSPGLLTSLLYWILFYFLFRYSFIKNNLNISVIIISGIIGTFFTILMMCAFLIFKKRFNH